MSVFGIKCPGCGILLEADEDDVGAKVECTECGKTFTLSRDISAASDAENKTITFTFDQPPSQLEYTQPVSVTMPNGTFPVKYWSDVHRLCLSYAFENNPDKLKELLDIEAPFRKGIIFSRHPETLRRSMELGDGIYAETNHSAHAIVRVVCGLMAYCGFPVKEFSVSYQKQNAQSNEEKQEPVATETSAVEFTKRLDFSTFTTGITIPVKCHETFLANLSVNLERGQSHLVTLVIGEHRFQVSINNIGFSDPNRKQVLAFLWGRKSPIAKSFQSTFPEVFRQLEEDHANRNGIDTELTVSCGEQPDVFKITMDSPLVKSKEPVALAQAEITVPRQPSHPQYGVPKKNNSSTHESSPTKKTEAHGVDTERAATFLKTAGLQGATVQELIDAIQPNAAFWPTKNLLDENLNVIAMPDNRYVHADCFVDLDEAEDALGKILSSHFARFDGYSNNQLLFGAALQELSMFLNDNDCENINAVYAIARYLFEKKAASGEKYKFAPPHIFETEPDHPLNLRGLMIRLARSNGGILHEVDAKNYLQKTMLTYGSMGQLLQVGNDKTFLMYDRDRYLLSEVIGIDDAWCRQMHDRMDDLFRKANVAYVIPRDISEAWLSTLPVLPLGLAWTPLLLQEILDKYPAIGFKSISAGLNQAYHTLAAAFVPIDSPLQTFPDVVTLFMEEHHKLPARMSGEELRSELRDKGMLEAGEMIYSIHKALNDYRFAWTDENKTVLIRGNK